MLNYVLFSGISELSDVSVPVLSDERQFTAAMASIQQQQEQQQPVAASGVGAPELIEAFHDQRVRQGDTVTFTCGITGTPKPKVRHYTHPHKFYIMFYYSVYSYCLKWCSKFSEFNIDKKFDRIV